MKSYVRFGKHEITFDELFLTYEMFSLLCLSQNINIILIHSILMLVIATTRFLVYRNNPISLGFRRTMAWFTIFWIIVFVNGFFITKYLFSWETLIIYLIPHLAVFLYFARGYSGELALNTLKKAARCTAIVSMAYIAVNDISNISSSMFRMGASVTNPNHIAMALVLFFAIELYERLYEERDNLIFCFVLAAFILLTGSKKGVLGLVVILTVLYVIKYKWNVYRYVFPVVLVLLTYRLIMNNELIYGILGRRLDAFFSDIGTERVSSTTERIGMYQYGWSKFLESPLIGQGYNFFRYTSGYNSYSHSNYIELLVSFGLVGFFSFYSIYFYNFFKSIRRKLIYMPLVVCIVG